MGLFSKMFKKRISQEELQKFFEKKDKAIGNILGEQFPFVFHSVIPFNAGGAVDMYVFPNVVEGTAFATMELIEYEDKGPIPNKNGMYELLTFTKLVADEQAINDEDSPFFKMLIRLRGIMTSIGQYSFTAKIEPGDTCEIPGDEGGENICLVFDEYKSFVVDDNMYGFLICMEIFRSEMEYAMENGSSKLFKKLKEKGYYPYSDLDREPVV